MTDAVSPNSVMRDAILMANLVAAARTGAAVVEQGALCLLPRELPHQPPHQPPHPHHIVQMTDAVSPNSVMLGAIPMANLVVVARSMAIAAPMMITVVQVASAGATAARHHIVQMTDAVSPNSIMPGAILMANLVAVARSMAIAAPIMITVVQVASAGAATAEGSLRLRQGYPRQGYPRQGYPHQGYPRQPPYPHQDPQRLTPHRQQHLAGMADVALPSLITPHVILTANLVAVARNMAIAVPMITTVVQVVLAGAAIAEGSLHLHQGYPHQGYPHQPPYPHQDPQRLTPHRQHLAGTADVDLPSLIMRRAILTANLVAVARSMAIAGRMTTIVVQAALAAAPEMEEGSLHHQGFPRQGYLHQPHQDPQRRTPHRQHLVGMADAALPSLITRHAILTASSVAVALNMAIVGEMTITAVQVASAGAVTQA
ncbi:MAG: hypothetical protein Q9186_002538 [Xanthomendoza sp. 1 TL-2023]